MSYWQSSMLLDADHLLNNEHKLEDWPGRLGSLSKGMSTSGTFDNVSLGLSNIFVGNPSGEAGLEITGGFFEGEFTDNHVIAICGSDMKHTVNGEAVPMFESIMVNTGDTIKFSHIGLVSALKSIFMNSSH